MLSIVKRTSRNQKLELGGSQQTRPRRSTPDSKRPSRYADTRATRLLAAKIAFIPHKSFVNEGAESEILDQSLPAASPTGRGLFVFGSLGDAPSRRTAAAKASPARDFDTATPALLTPEQERQLFRQMNFLKFTAEMLRRRLKSSSASEADLDRIESLLASARQVRDRIVEANLRLVVFVARQHMSRECPLAELVSEGNMSLLKAVEKFDFSRGFRFSTYATWALKYNFNRSLAGARRLRTRFLSSDDALSEVADEREAIAERPPEDLHRDKLAIRRILRRLDAREQSIVCARFGLGREESRSLKEIAAELGICKERVRQLQIRALEKLRTLAERINLKLPEDLD